MRDVFRAYLLRRIGTGTRADFKRHTGIGEGDLANACNGKKTVSIGMLEKIAKADSKPLSSMLMELAQVALELQAMAVSEEGAARPELRAVLRVSARKSAAAPPDAPRPAPAHR